MAKRPDQFLITLPPQQRERLKTLQAETGRSRSELIREAVDRYLTDREERPMQSLINAVADLMYEADSVDPTGGRTDEEWAARNAEGWTVDRGTAHGSYLRDESVILEPAELAQAIAKKDRMIVQHAPRA